MEPLHSLIRISLIHKLISSLWCSPDNMPASHAGDHRSEAGQGHQISAPPKHFERCTSLVWKPARCNSGWGLQFRSRVSAQAGFIRPPCPGQHWGLRPFTPPCSSLWISFVKKSCRGSTGWRLQFAYFSGEWLRGNSRPRRSRVCEPWRCKSSLAHHFFGAEATEDRHRTFNPVW